MKRVIVATVLGVMALGCVSTSPRAPSRAPASAPAPHTPTRTWENVQEEIVKSEASVTSDPVSVFLSYKAILGSEFESSPEQRQGLIARMAVLEPLATARLNTDYQQAVKEGCLRDATLIGLIKTLAATNAAPILLREPLRARLSQQVSNSLTFTWTVSDVEVVDVGPEFYASVPGAGQDHITVPSGTLVRVSACISNVSISADVPYIVWSFGWIKRVVGNDQRKPGEVGRWLDNVHIELSVNGAIATTCMYICQDSDIPTPASGIRMHSVTVSEAGPIFVPAFIPPGKSARLNMLFTVPGPLGPAELRVLGAKPVTATIKPRR